MQRNAQKFRVFANDFVFRKAIQKQNFIPIVIFDIFMFLNGRHGILRTGNNDCAELLGRIILFCVIREMKDIKDHEIRNGIRIDLLFIRFCRIRRQRRKVDRIIQQICGEVVAREVKIAEL